MASEYCPLDSNSELQPVPKACSGCFWEGYNIAVSARRSSLANESSEVPQGRSSQVKESRHQLGIMVTGEVLRVGKLVHSEAASNESLEVVDFEFNCFKPVIN
jgi:hypothetical protein